MWRQFVRRKMKNKQQVSGKDGISEFNFELSPSHVARELNGEAKDKYEELGSSFYDLLAKVEENQEYLFELIRNNDHKSLQKLLNHNPSLINSTITKKHKSPLHVACECGHIPVLNAIVNCGIDINISDGEGNTGLHDSVEHDSRTSISFLLRQGADPNIVNSKGMAPLHLAVVLDRIESLKELLNHPSVDPNIFGEYDSTPLHYAAWRERPECAELLIEHNAKLCQKNAIGLCPLHVAAQSSSAKTMEVIIKKANSIGCGTREEILNKLNQEKNTPLHTAVLGGNLQIVQVCLKTGYDVSQTQESGSNSLHLAASQGNIDIIKTLLEFNPEKRQDLLKSTNMLGHTVLHEAAAMDRYEAVKFFLNEDVEIHAKAKNGCNALLLAASKQAWKSLNILMGAGLDWSAKDENSRNVLHLIIIGCSQPGEFDICLKAKIMSTLMNDVDKFGCTPLHYASKQGFRRTIAHLLDMGAQLNVKTNKQQSALHFAASCGRINTCKELLRNISNTQIVNETDSSGRTPLHLAAAGGHDKVVALFMKIGATISKDFNGDTPLHLAAMNGYTRTLKSILTIHTHFIDVTNKAMNTCLHLAALESQTSVITLLLNLGAKMSHNVDGLHPFELAISKELKDACIAFITHDRWKEAMELRSKLFGCNMVGLIEHLPEVCQMVLDRCRIASGPDQKDPNFHYIYDFEFLQVDPVKIRECKKHGITILPLFALNLMVKHNRVECLYHPLCLAFLHSKWTSYGVWFFFIDLLIYGVFLGSLTFFVCGFDFVEVSSLAEIPSVIPNITCNYISNVAEEFKFNQLTVAQRTCVFIVIAYCFLNAVKEIFRFLRMKGSYFKDFKSCGECLLSITCTSLMVPLVMNICHPIQWQIGSLAIFMTWFNLLVHFQGLGVFGIYVVMFMEILKTLLQVILVFSILIVAFGLAFYISLNTGSSPSFQTPQISLVTSTVMMLGAIDFFQTWVEPDSRGKLPNHLLNYFLLLLFILLMPILLINLLIGLAVGDIGAVLKNAKLKKISMQITMYTEIEQKLPARLIKLIDKPFLKVYVNSKCSKMKAMAMSMVTVNQSVGEEDIGQKDSLEHQSLLYTEFHQQKLRLKHIQRDMMKNHELLRLIIQKMEIQTEVDDQDEDIPDSGILTRKTEDHRDSIGWSSLALKHSILKQAFTNSNCSSRGKIFTLQAEDSVPSTPR